uniref:olfactory receptor 5V1-like n=1 Tax=Podarcis muralis TaxID=64176 RepID=UPI0010A0395C|nr:olfactory receptor 5V1-like [Podarcis muralis]
MELKNQSAVQDFILLGLSSSPEHQKIIFWGFTLIYATALSANFLFIFTLSTCRKLHTPMYFLLIHLSIANMFCISVTIPKMLQTTLASRKTISFSGCIAQVYFFLWALGTEILLLSFMAFDRFIAICHPLQYTVIMRREVYIGVVAGVWVAGMINSAVHTGLVLRLSFCDSNIINHFFCNLPPLLMLSCSDTFKNEVAVATVTVFFILVPFLLILLSYMLIIATILKMPSAKNRHKAFSTCSSHLIVVSLFYGTVTFTYVRPKSVYSLDSDRILSLLYTVVTPSFNPIIYSLRNKEIKAAFKKSIARKEGLP